MWKINEDGFMECVKDFSVCIDVGYRVKAGTIGAKIPESCGIHKESWIEFGCNIGENVKVSSNSWISRGTDIGENTLIAQDVVVGSNCRISNDVTISARVHLGNYVRIRSEVRLARGVRICSGTNIHERCRIGDRTWIGEETTIESGCNIEYSCEIGSHVSVEEDCYLCENVKISDWVAIGFGTGIRPNITIPRSVQVPAHQWIELDNFWVFVNQGTKCRPVFMMFDSRASSKTTGDVMVTVGCQNCITFSKFLKRIKNATGTSETSAAMYRQNIPLFKAVRKQIILNRARSLTKRIMVHLGF